MKSPKPLTNTILAIFGPIFIYFFGAKRRNICWSRLALPALPQLHVSGFPLAGGGVRELLAGKKSAGQLDPPPGIMWSFFVPSSFGPKRGRDERHGDGLQEVRRVCRKTRPESTPNSLISSQTAGNGRTAQGATNKMITRLETSGAVLFG